MTNTFELNPESFGLPAELRWAQTPVRIGTVAVTHKLSLAQAGMRTVMRLRGVPGGLENATWSGLGVTIPKGWAIPGEFPTEDNATEGITGVNRLPEKTSGNNTVLRQDELGSLAVGLATYFQVGINARVVTIESNSAFDPDVARQYANAKPGEIEGFRTLGLTEAQRVLLQEVDYDPAKYLTASMQTLPVAREVLCIAETDDVIRSMTYDLLLPLK